MTKHLRLRKWKDHFNYYSWGSIVQHSLKTLSYCNIQDKCWSSCFRNNDHMNIAREFRLAYLIWTGVLWTGWNKDEIRTESPVPSRYNKAYQQFNTTAETWSSEVFLLYQSFSNYWMIHLCALKYLRVRNELICWIAEARLNRHHHLRLTVACSQSLGFLQSPAHVCTRNLNPMCNLKWVDWTVWLNQYYTI